MSDIERVSPERVREKVQSESALLVCAYQDDQRYMSMRLDGSIALSKFISGIAGIAKDQEIIFY